MPTVPSFDWVKTGWATLLIALVTFTTGYGARSQTINEHERRIERVEQNYVPKDEYRQILYRLDALSEEVKAFRIEQARLNGARR